VTGEAAPTRILFIGNSYTTRNNLPRLVAGLAADAEASREVQVETIFAGGASLRRHWNAGVAQRTLATRRFDVVVLQEQSTLPIVTDDDAVVPICGWILLTTLDSPASPHAPAAGELLGSPL